MSFSYQIKKDNNLLIIALQGNLIGKEQVGELFNEIDFELNEGVENIIIDLEDMQYLNSTGLSIFIQILTKVRNNGGDVVVVNVPEKINKLLVITKLNSVFNIKDSVENAKLELIKN
ncbi:MAG: STAS domain-containing protein [Flavobacteriales bacterium]|nr:STAS domain-containing protein [Flavobacteriales bacterium]